MTEFRDLAGEILDKSKELLGQDVTYYSKDGVKIEIRGIFDDTVETLDNDAETLISSQRYTLDVKLSDLPDGAPFKGDTVRIGNRRFVVYDSLEDGHGASMLILHEIDE